MILARPFTASGAITAHRIVRLSSESVVAQAVNATSRLIGVYTGPSDAADASTGNVVCLLGECLLDTAGSVNAGDLLTADANGKGIVAAPAAGANNRIIAVALVGGTDLTIRVLVVPGMMQGA